MTMGQSINRYWSAAEDNYLRSQASTATDEEIAAYLGRPTNGVHQRKLKLGLINRNCKWSAHDDQYLRKHWQTLALQDIAHTLDRSKRAVYQRALKLGLPQEQPINPPGVRTLSDQRYWTNEDKQRLRQTWSTVSLPEIAQMLERSLRSVKSQAKRLGLPANPSGIIDHELSDQTPTFYEPRAWTPNEDQQFRSMYLAGESLEIISHTLQRSISAIEHRRIKASLKREAQLTNWSADQDDFLRKNWGSRSIEQIGLSLGMFNDRVARRARKLGLTDRSDLLRQAYTVEEIDYLRANYPRLKAKDLAANLNRSVISVQNKLQQLKKSPELVAPQNWKAPRPADYYWSEEEDAFLKASYPHQTNQQLATTLGRTKRAVVTRLQQLGLKRDKHLIFETLDQLPDSYATSLISKDPTVRQELLNYPDLLTLRKAKLILDKRIRTT